jgi:rhodanese-related sulfurtransferase
VLHTPGHTLESSTFLLKDEAEKPLCIFTGDTLFIGDVGRPDLAIKSTLTQEDLAGMLYDSLRNKIMHLPDDVIVYPAHGAGSACGKNMSKETFDTLGNQKKINYALRNITKTQFIKELTEGILPAPQYFAKNAALNKTGYENYTSVLAKGSKALNPDQFESVMNDENVVVLDVRKPEDFAAGHIPNALFIGLDGQFAPWVGTIIKDIKSRILLVTPLGREEEAVMRLSRVGYDNCIGYLENGFDNWKNAGKNIETVKSIPSQDFIQLYTNGANTLDVRKPGEFESGHLKNAESRPLDFILEWVELTDHSRPYMVHCAGGYRSMIAISMLKAKGFKDLTDVRGGFGAIKLLDEAKAEIVTEAVKA